MSNTATITGVELVRVGDWNAAAGDGNITTDDLAACVAAYDDQLVDRPVLKLGHQDNNRLNEDASTNGGFGDGEPAYGWVENLRLSEDGQALVGDYVGMPAKLAEVAPTAWRRRSVELLRNVKTAAGKSYRAALAGVALLGIMRPAAKGLQDVLDLYADAESADSLTVLELVDGMTATQVATFGEFLDGLASVHDTAAVPHETDDGADADGVDHDKTTKEAPMGKGKGLTREKVLAALDAEGDRAIEDRLNELLDDGNDDGTDTDTDDLDDATTDEEDGKTSLADGDLPETVTLSKGQFVALRDGANAGTEAAKILAEQDRAKVIKTALSEGRIAPADKAKWETMLAKDTEGTKALLADLTPVFPTVEVGDDATHETTDLSEAAKAAEDEFLDNIAPARA